MKLICAAMLILISTAALAENDTKTMTYNKELGAAIVSAVCDAKTQQTSKIGADGSATPSETDQLARLSARLHLLESRLDQVEQDQAATWWPELLSILGGGVVGWLASLLERRRNEKSRRFVRIDYPTYRKKLEKSIGDLSAKYVGLTNNMQELLNSYMLQRRETWPIEYERDGTDESWIRSYDAEKLPTLKVELPMTANADARAIASDCEAINASVYRANLQLATFTNLLSALSCFTKDYEKHFQNYGVDSIDDLRVNDRFQNDMRAAHLEFVVHVTKAEQLRLQIIKRLTEMDTLHDSA